MALLVLPGRRSACVPAITVDLICHAEMFCPQAASITKQFPARNCNRYSGASLAMKLADLLSDAMPATLLGGVYISTKLLLSVNSASRVHR